MPHPSESSVARLRVLLSALAAFALTGCGLAAWVTSLGWKANTWQGSDNIFYHLFATYDCWHLAFFAVICLALAWVLEREKQMRVPSQWPRLSIRWLAFGVFAIAALGTHLVFFDYPFAMDEFYADFQASIFAEGKLWAVPPAEWRPMTYAATPMLANLQPENGAWTANYLPVYALLRVPFWLIGCSWLLNPLLAAGTILLLAKIVRTIWPTNSDLPLIGCLLLASSPQFLITSMTAYAMPAHVFFNLLWLVVFVRNDRWSFWIPPWIGVCAMGLHQPNIHFFFVAPFILRLLWNRRWAISAYFLGVYAAGSLFWIQFIQWRTPVFKATAGTPIYEQFTKYFELPSPAHLRDQLIGLTQIVAWNNCALILLAAAGLFAWKKSSPVIADLLAGMILALGCTLLFKENQGHGWGNRYFYSYIGSFVLIAVAGFEHFRAEFQPYHWRLLGAVSAMAFCVQFPLQVWGARRVVHPFAATRDYLESRPVESVVINTNRIWYGQDLVRNAPALAGHPKVFFLSRLRKRQIAFLEQRNSYEVVKEEDLAGFGITPRIMQPK